jgi:type III restriction enzyme
MQLKNYQTRTLETVRSYLEQLAELKAKAAKVQEVDPELDFDFAVKAWEKTGVGRPYFPRRTGLGEPLPSVCLKIPTGGGKTLLAAHVVDLVNMHYRKKQTGLVLWIMPTTQIYNQTLAALRDRDHPYRQLLDAASAGRTLILEKQSGFTPADVLENLCVLMLMLPSANRQSNEQLRMFRDSGGFDQFFPGDDDAAGHTALLKKIRNLDTFEKQSGFWGRQIKTSLGNTLRLLNPLIILDEGHKAYSDNARKTIEGFNPCLLVELSATPPKNANVLVEILGKELLDEEMIKLDLHIQNRASPAWKDTMLATIEHREYLEEQARKYQANTNIYIRPICLIQVERTGKDQRKPGIVHADDVKEYLVKTRQIPEEQIAIKTAQVDELKEINETGGLLARDCPVRYIITKQALQEGWDCSFAYVLTILTNPGSRNALTQLVGRILRQPYAKKTSVAALDESYVFCFQQRGRDLLKEVRKGFGLEGLGDLEGRIVQDTGAVPKVGEEHFLEPRKPFRTSARNLVLPAFFISDRGEWRLVHYEADILSRVPWGDVDISPLFNLTLTPVSDKDVEMRAGLDERILDQNVEAAATALPQQAARDLDYAFVAGHLLDVLPNPWRGHEMGKRVFDKLLKRYSGQRELVTANFVFVVEELRKRLQAERDRLAEQVFQELLEQGKMRFMVLGQDFGFTTRLPKKIAVPVGEKRATRLDGNQFVLSLFDHVPDDAMNSLEHQVASYLDEQENLFFWYRNTSRRDYAVQGWKRGRIFADFIFTASRENAGASNPYHEVFVVETKGLHLKLNADTNYKRSVFNLCTEHAKKRDWSEFVPAMRNKTMRFEVVDEDEWQVRLNELLAGGKQASA